MTVYAEYLFLENFITGMILLYFSGRICGKKAGKARLAAGGVLCGLFSFILFVPIGHTVVSLAVKLIFSAAVTAATFRTDRRSFPRLLLTFYITSFLMGGMTVAIVYLTGIRGISANGAVYMAAPSYAVVTAGVILSALLLKTFAGWIGERVRSEKLRRQVRIEIGAQRFTLSAYTDTGNSLRDPLSKAPVFVISERRAREILATLTEAERQRRYCVIPFRAAGTKHGLMEGFRADRMVIEESGVFAPAVLAVYRGRFLPGRGTEEFDVLLNRETVEGGISG